MRNKKPQEGKRKKFDKQKGKTKHDSTTGNKATQKKEEEQRKVKASGIKEQKPDRRKKR